MTERNQAIKADAGKPRMELLMPRAMIAWAKVMTYGANKYGDCSWKQVEIERYIGALLRHLMAFMEDYYSIDEESGMPHIWHVFCNAGFLTDKLEDLKDEGVSNV